MGISYPTNGKLFLSVIMGISYPTNGKLFLSVIMVISYPINGKPFLSDIMGISISDWMSLKYIVDESNGKSLNASHPYSRKCNPYGYEKALTYKIHMQTRN